MVELSLQIALVGVLTLLSGLGDAQGFLHASNVWVDGAVRWSSVAMSAAGFAFGSAMYWLTLRHLTALGVVVPEVQTIFWFVATIVGVGLASRAFLQWRTADQMVAVGVVVGVAWLLLRTGSAG
jgi:hypothetical protein